MTKRRTLFSLLLAPFVIFAILIGSSSCCHLQLNGHSPTSPTTMPIIYHPKYNITFFGMEKLHPFDSTKYGRVYDQLVERNIVRPGLIHQPGTVTDEQLLLVHTQRYLDSLKDSKTVSHIAEMPALGKLPNRSLQCNLLTPKRLATGGTILAAQLALEKGWAINLSGGYHHAKADSGEGFCVFADIPVAAAVLWQSNPELRVMVVDLDAHQGNGFESIFQNDERVAMYDLYNAQVYPNDTEAKAFIDYDYPIPAGTVDADYLKLLNGTLPGAIAAAKPDLLIYNAGTDIFEKDPLGALKITREGIIERDEIVFQLCKQAGVPVAMVMSGGYTKDTAGIIADSIENLSEKGLLTL